MRSYAVKLLAVAVAGIALAAAAGYFANAALRGDGAALLFALIALALFFAVFAIQCAVISDKWTGLAAIMCEVAAVGVFFYAYFGLVLAGAALLAALFLFAGYRAARGDFDNNFRIRFSSSGGRALRWASRGLAAFFAAVIALAIATADTDQAKQFIAGGAATLPGFSRDRSLREVVGGVAEKTLSSPLGALPAGAKDQVIGEATNQLVQIVGQFAGARVRPGDNVVDALYAAIAGFLQKLSPLAQKLLLVVLGALLYSLIKTILSLLGWVSGILASLLFTLLVAVKFVQIRIEPRDKEIISMI